MTTIRRWLWIAGAVLAAAAGGYAFGRYAQPAKVVETTKVEWRDRVVTKEVVREVKVQGPVRVTERIVEKPGAERIVERVIERASTTTTTDAASASDATSNGISEATKTVEYVRPQWAAEFGGQWKPTALQIKPSDLDAAVSRRILEPVWLSATITAPTDRLGYINAYRFGLRTRVEW